MTVVKAIFSHFLAFLMAIVLTVYPYAGERDRVIDNLNDDCRLTVDMMSDTHLEKYGVIRWLEFTAALKNISKADVVDAIMVDGDITNYADEYSLAKYFDTIKNYSTKPVISVPGNHDIGHAGDRDVTDISREQALENFVNYRNDYFGMENEKNYYSTEFNGYKFIIIGDEVIDGGRFDAITMTDEQLQFLDRELAEGTKDGKPVFVCCHWPISYRNGEEVCWPECGIDPENEYDIPAILEKYENVFWISGHMHAGIKSRAVEKLFNLSSAETVNGVTYINLPTFGLVNMFGVPWSATGAQLEVYDNEVVYRPMSLITNYWYVNSEYHFELK